MARSRLPVVLLSLVLAFLLKDQKQSPSAAMCAPGNSVEPTQGQSPSAAMCAPGSSIEPTQEQSPSAAMCAPGDSVAVGCNLTGGLRAAIIIVCSGGILVGGILCMFCCWPKQTACCQAMAARRAQQSRGTVHMNVNPPGTSEQPLLSDPELPTYLEAVAEIPGSSAPPPYK